jgi:hypothetical protein
MSKRLAAAVLLLAASTEAAAAGTRLVFFELQAVGGYSTAAKKLVAYSMAPMEAMQKPGLGFDLVQRFSGKAGDVAVLAVQGRLAWNAEAEDSGLKTFEPQIYNAYLRFKLKVVDLWVGHNKPKFGLSSSLDSHAALLQPLAMSGYGFDRDWGIGFERDTAWGSAGISVTTGSGMALRIKNGCFVAGRVERGVLSRDNSSGGFSVAYGLVQNVMGNHLMSDALVELAMASFDFSWVRNNWENRLEVLGGGRDGKGMFILFWRTGIGLLEENRLKLEAQPVVKLAKQSTDGELALGATYALTPDWTLRAMAAYDTAMKDFKVVFQVYLLKNLGI